jgi:flagellar FliJ protein
MAKFNFKMQNLLNIKEQMEIMCQNELSKATKKYLFQKEKLISIENNIEETILNMKNNENGKLSVNFLMLYLPYIERMKLEKKNAERLLKSAEKEVEDYRMKLMEAVKEKKMYEVLKEKRFNEFKIELQHQEDKNVDELISYKYSSEQY